LRSGLRRRSVKSEGFGLRMRGGRPARAAALASEME
jgi:hypothetical protein